MSRNILITCTQCKKLYGSVTYKGKNHDIPVCIFCRDIEIDMKNGVKFSSYQGIQEGHLVVNKNTKEFLYVRIIESRFCFFGKRNYYYCDDWSSSFWSCNWFKEEDIRPVCALNDQECFDAENFIISRKIGYALSQDQEQKEPEPEWIQLAEGIYRNLGGRTRYEKKMQPRLGSEPDYDFINTLPKAVSLFSGCGGYDLGVCKSFNIVGHVEMENAALDTYEGNKQKCGFGNSELIGHDITKISNKEIKNFKKKHGKISFVFGGPPCQGFSTTGKRDPKDPRNSLFMEFVRFVRILQPDSFQVENVPGMKSMKNGKGEKVLDIILETFRKEGYTLEWAIYNAANYGVPQNRRRVIITGVKGNKIPSGPLPLFFDYAEGLTLAQWKEKILFQLTCAKVSIPQNASMHELEQLWDQHILGSEYSKLLPGENVKETGWMSSNELDVYLKEHPEVLEE